MRLFGYTYNNDLVICNDSPDYLYFSKFSHGCMPTYPNGKHTDIASLFLYFLSSLLLLYLVLVVPTMSH